MSTQATSLPLGLRGRRRARNMPKLALVAGAFILLWTLIALAAPLLVGDGPQVDLTTTYASSSSEHLLGTDASGRDILARLVDGARTALVAPLAVAFLSGVIGCVVAFAAALARGWVDAVLSRVIDLLFAFPSILLALIGAAIFGGGIKAAVGALAIAYIPYMARVVRSEGLRQTSTMYIENCRLNGLPSLAIAVRHLLPNLLPLIVAQFTLSFGYAIIDLASISYLGLGVQAPAADWGLMVQEGQAGIVRGYPQESLYAGILIVLLVVSFSIVGDHLNSRYEKAREG
jgi:peptide/nickel transport system permease protein